MMTQVDGECMITKKVKSFIKKYQLLEPNKTVLVGVSGGPDSMALLHLLKEESEINGLHIIAVGVDHQLRGDASEQDMLYVEAQCERWNIPFIKKKVDVEAYKQTNKVGTQVAARTLRYEVFAEVMKEYEADYLALGHHGDDQIETMLMGVMRTTSIQGLKGIPYTRHFATGKIIRPLLLLTKEEIETYCDIHQIEPRIDASNFETDYTRNELRLDVVPILKEKNHRLHQTIQQLSETIQEDESFLMDQAAKVIKDVIQIKDKKCEATILLPAFKKQPVSLQRRLFRLTLNYLYKENIPDKISYTHEEIFLRLIGDQLANKSIDFPNGLKIEKSYEKVHLYFDQAEKNEIMYERTITSLPLEIALPNGDILHIERTKISDTKKTDVYTLVYPEKEIAWPLHIRHRRRGDRMSYEGLNGSKKLKDIFIDEKVPRDKRDTKYILTDDDGEILWLIGLRKKGTTLTTGDACIVVTYIKND